MLSERSRDAWLRSIADATGLRKLSASDFLIAYELVRHTVGRDIISVYQATLAKNTGLTERTVRRSLKAMRDAGFLRRKRGGPYVCDMYLLCINDTPIFESLAA